MMQRIQIALCLALDAIEGGRVVYGSYSVKRKTAHLMEDYHVEEVKRINNHELQMFAIYDGHFGQNVPRYLKDNLFDNILNRAEFWDHPLEAMTRAYEQTDRAILEQAPKLGAGGSTAVTVILRDYRDLFVANVGDSRAVICRGGRAIQLTVDHDPSTERQSIEEKGGSVSFFPGDVPRVNGQLAVARTFGDKNLKPYLRSDPDTREWVVDVNDKFLILASDGLWKVIQNQEAVELVEKLLMKYRSPKDVAKSLVKTAITRHSTDDISCIILQFQSMSQLLHCNKPAIAIHPSSTSTVF